MWVQNRYYWPPDTFCKDLAHFLLTSIWPSQFNFSAISKTVIYAGWYGFMVLVAVASFVLISRRVFLRARVTRVLCTLILCYLAMYLYSMAICVDCGKYVTMVRYLMPMFPLGTYPRFLAFIRLR